jgi:hypothetical protein
MKKLFLLVLVGMFTTYVIGQTQTQTQPQKDTKAPTQQQAKPATQTPATTQPQATPATKTPATTQPQGDKPVKTEIKATDLPKKATDYLAANMKDYTIEKAFKEEFKGSVSYYVTLAKGTEKHKAYFDKDGNFIKKPASGGSGQLGQPPAEKKAEPAPAPKK